MTHAALTHVRVVLVRPQGPINIGLVCRACANLGVGEVRLVTPQVPVPCAQSRMFAHHAQPLLAEARMFDSVASAVQDCDLVIGTSARRRRDTLPYVPPEAIGQVRTSRRAQTLALVFGSEASGLTAEDLAHCDLGVYLEAPGPYPSYNLSHAVAITLYLASRTPREASQAQEQAGHGTRERLFTHWLATLERTGYFRRTTASRFAPKLRRLLGRLHLSDQDTNTLWGMLSHFGGRGEGKY